MKQFFLAVILCAIFSCNNNSVTDKNDSAKSAMMPLVESMQKQLHENPDSIGLRLQYAYALDSVKMYKEALVQMDTLVNNDTSNYGLSFAQGQIAEDAGDTLLALKSYAHAAHLYESPD